MAFAAQCIFLTEIKFQVISKMEHQRLYTLYDSQAKAENLAILKPCTYKEPSNGETRTAYKILIRKPLEKQTFGSQ
jgi:hypothetical protein